MVGKLAIFQPAAFTLQLKKILPPALKWISRLRLPAEITRGTEVFVRAHGRVIRVDKRRDEDHETIGVAAVIERYDIIRGETVSHLTIPLRSDRRFVLRHKICVPVVVSVAIFRASLLPLVHIPPVSYRRIVSHLLPLLVFPELHIPNPR